ncbi:MAG TPA: biotin transporter BioY [Coriobacteriia bacterium]|nr:biotin transporter BioY [Coriobacteriia bacterium]
MQAKLTGRPARTRQLVAAALVTALIAASAWITLPIGAVPVTLQVFVVVLAALLLEPVWAGASIALYLVMGAAGLPVFAGAKGGLGVIAGPTGGYLMGFLVAAVIAASVRGLWELRGSQLVADVVAAALAIAVIYVVGTVQLALVLHMSAAQAVVAGVVPFVGPDLAKAAAAVLVASAVRRGLRA